MEVYGLTGGIGSGKSTVAALLEDYGIPVVSADELSRMVVAPGSRGLADVVEAFGPEVLDEKGELDRKKMGQIVFATPERRRQLEAILHPRIRERYEQVLDALEKAGHPVMVYEVPLLFEKKLDQQDEMKGVILVTCSADTRIARVKARDSLTTEDVLARMRAQMPEQEKRSRADYIIHNDGDLDDLRRETEYLISRFLRLPPRAEQGRVAEPEIVPELELDESEIDTLSPEEVIEEVPTAKINIGVPDPAGAEASADPGSDELSVTLGLHEPSGGDTSAERGSELEVELSPTPPGPMPSKRATPAPATPIAAAKPPPVAPAPAPQAAPPAQAAPQAVQAPPVAPPPPTQAAAPAGAPPAPAPPLPVPAVLTPAQAGFRPRPPRPRKATIPQMSVPQIGNDQPADTSKPTSGDGEEPST